MPLFALVGYGAAANLSLSHRRDAGLQRRPTAQFGQVGHCRMTFLHLKYTLAKQKPHQINRLDGVLRTEGRDRTGTSVTSSVFETDASTDSATSASWFLASNAAAKIRIFLFTASKLRKISVFILFARIKYLILQPQKQP